MKVKVVTYGCAANKADSELMMGLLKEAGHEIVSDNPDAYLINTCTVKNRTEAKIKYLLKSLEGKKVIVAGCMSNANPELRNEFPEYVFIGINDCNKIVEALEKNKTFITKKPWPKLCMPKIRTDPLIEIIPISQGCLGNCAFCKTKLAKGALYSYPKELIVRHARNALKDGVKEIWITSQDNACYGFDIGTNLVELLKEILSLPYDFRVRLGMMNPDTALKLKGLPEIFKSEKMYKFVHIPVQSGSDKVLKDMGRKYTVNEFKMLVNSFRRIDPYITISTDVICGYPTETEDDWKKTIKLIKWLKPGVLNISRFYARPGTAASKLKQLPFNTVKKRSKEITQLFRKIKSERKVPKSKIWVTGRDIYYRLAYTG